MLTVSPIKAFQDNYIWCIQNSNSSECIIVDPGDEKPVIEYLESKQLVLKAIFITHHHYDHTDGIDGLLSYAQKNQTQSPMNNKIDVFGPDNPKINQVTQPLKQHDCFELFDTQFCIDEVPGHTLDHISYFSAGGATHATPWLFCGDTLFSGGCGRLFEGTPLQMLNSLIKLTQYIENTEIYCTHEYTLSNLSFAKAVLPDNMHLQQYIDQCTETRALNHPTLPSTISTELAINPFLNCSRDDIRSSVLQHTSQTTGVSAKELANESDVFTALRAWKDVFRG